MQERPKKKGPPKWPVEFEDDVQGPRRDYIISEYLKWYESPGAQSTERDFSEAPIKKFADQRRKSRRWGSKR